MKVMSNLTSDNVAEGCPGARNNGEALCRKAQKIRVLRGILIAAVLSMSVARVDAATKRTTVAAYPATPVTVTDRGEYSIVTFDLPRRTAYSFDRVGTEVLLHFTDAGLVNDAKGSRSVRSVQGGAKQASITVDPGSHVRVLRRGWKVVVEVSSSSAQVDEPKPISGARTLPHDTQTPPGPPSSIAADTGEATGPAETSPSLEAPAGRHADQVAVVSTPLPMQPSGTPMSIAAAHPVEAGAKGGDGSLALMAYKPQDPAAVDGSIVLPFARNVGAAAFRQRGEAVIVFDTARPIDLSAVQNGVFASARVTMLPDATIMRLGLPLSNKLRLTHQADGWKIAVVPASELPQPIDLADSNGEIAMMTSSPSRVVTIVNPATGGMLLIGAQLSSGQGVTTGHSVPEFRLLPTWQGIAIEPFSDRLSLRSGPDRFVLAAQGQSLGVSAAGATMASAQRAASLTRRFDLPALPADALLRRLDGQVHQIAETPPLARFAPRMAAAQTMLSLGMGAEAQAMVALAAADDPRHASDPDTTLLSSMGALIAGRPSEADALADPGLTSTDEGALWHAAWIASRGISASGAGSLFAAELSLLRSYPESLREHLLAPAIETMIEAGGDPKNLAKESLKANPDDKSLDFARALLAEKDADTASALRLFDKVAQGHDRLARVRAARAAVELRLQTGALDAGKAANLLEQQITDWRGDDREYGLRSRIATLLAQAGRWSDAFDVLRETMSLFPENDEQIRTQATSLLGDMLDPANKTLPSPIDFVALVDGNSDMISSNDVGAHLLPLLSERLVALDLTQRAMPVLAKLMAAAPQGASRAGIGAKLAAVQLEAGDGRAACATLEISDAPNLPANLESQRMLLLARALAQQGDLNRAQATLAQLHSVDGDDLRARMSMSSHDWPAAEAALAQLAASVVPDQGPLDARARDVLLRLSSAAAQAGDNATLRHLRDTEANRMGAGPAGDMFRLLTAAPVHDAKDLPRAASEIALAKTFPDSLQSLAVH